MLFLLLNNDYTQIFCDGIGITTGNGTCTGYRFRIPCVHTSIRGRPGRESAVAFQTITLY